MSGDCADSPNGWIFKNSLAVREQIASMEQYSSTPQLPFQRPQIPSNRYQKALNRGTLGGLGSYQH